MLIITTVGRSGSSFLARYCEAIGLDVGSTRWIDDLDAGYEDKITVQINGIIRRDKRASTATLKRIAAIETKVVKDPQFLIHEDYIRQWWKARQDISVILLVRQPEHIVESLRRHPAMNSPVFRNHVDMITECQIKFIKKLDHLGIPFTVFEYPYFLDRFDKMYKALKQYCIIRNSKSFCKQEWEKLVDKTMVHVRS